MKKIEKTLIRNSYDWKPCLHNGFLQNSNSWFSLRKKHMFKIDEPEKKIETQNIRCKTIQIKPTIKQRNTLLTWFELSRIAYNLTIKNLRKNNTIKDRAMRDIIKQEMRNNLYISSLIKKSGIYQQTLDNAVKDVYKARKTGISNIKSKNIKFFRLRYKSQKHHIKNLVLETDALNHLGTGLKKRGLENLSPSETIKRDKITRLGYNSRTKQFNLFMPYEKKTETQLYRRKICALDPGIRTFQTLYSPSGITYQFGDEKNIIKKNIDRIEKVKLLKDKSWYKKYVNRLRTKLKNRITDMHWKVSSFLCKNFDTILVGNMSTKGIVKKSVILHNTTKRMTYALSHYLFKERLQSKAQEYNCIVKIVDESYTSKTCGGCGEIKDDLGSAKEFQCSKPLCYYKMHRDIHGARNIYIKNKI